MLRNERRTVLGKIAAELEQAVRERMARGTSGTARATLLGRGEHWAARDVLCTSGPADRVYEEQHGTVSVALVLSGTFQYRAGRRPELMTGGAMLLGNAGQCFECGHEHAAGDRCISLQFDAGYFDRIAADLGVPPSERRFRGPRVPPARESAELFARATAAVAGAIDASWEELSLEAAVAALRLSGATVRQPAAPSARTLGRVIDGAREIEREPARSWTLAGLAAAARLSEFRYLRAFREVTGVTPHQFVLRTRLREAAACLLSSDARVIDVALEAGFGDLSNFNHAFRAEFGVPPTRFRVAGR